MKTNKNKRFPSKLDFLTLHAIYHLQNSSLGSQGIRKFLTAHRGNQDYEKSLPIDLMQKLVDLDLQLQKEGIIVIKDSDSFYPVGLKSLKDAPNFLFLKGNPDLLKRKMITIVGTRRITPYGMSVINNLLSFSALEYADITIVSGLAYGVDSCVHNISLKKSIGTIAVVAGGIDKGFPEGNRKLYEELCVSGAVISEFPPGKVIVKGMFPMRNRLMAAMSSSTLVVEAGERSGSLITSQIALDIGRDVYSVPGDINRTYSRGCNKLITSGAIPVIDYVDFWRENSVNLGDSLALGVASKFSEITDVSTVERLVKIIKENGEISLGSASEASSIDSSKLIVLLTNLEIEGILSRNELGNYTYNY